MMPSDTDESSIIQDEEDIESESTLFESDTEAYSDEDILDQIFFFDQVFLDSDKVDGACYLGLCYHEDDYYLFANAVSPGVFGQFRTTDICQYLTAYSLRVDPLFPHIEIMKLCIVGDTYTVILKTHWIRLVQRRWKRVYQMRQDALRKRMHLVNIRYNQMRGHYPPDVRYVYGMQGMLGELKCV